MNNIIVGNSGFVGSNLILCFNFDGQYNSKNIKKAYKTNPDILVYAGVRSQKYIANNNPNLDLEHVNDAIYNIKMINPKKIILISTIDVYKTTSNVNEDTKIVEAGLHPYGLHRYYLEKFVKDFSKNHHIFRLPALYGKNLRKNFIYDLLNPIPNKISSEKIKQIASLDCRIFNYYRNDDLDYYSLDIKSFLEKEELIKILNNANFSSLNFTDSRSVFQFYNLSYLWGHINISIKNNFRIVNLVTEPVSSNDVYYSFYKKNYENIINDSPLQYDIKTIYDKFLGGYNGYIFSKNSVLKNINKYLTYNKLK